MAQTRLFKNGHSQAVRIPAELAYPGNDLLPASAAPFSLAHR